MSIGSIPASIPVFSRDAPQDTVDQKSITSVASSKQTEASEQAKKVLFEQNVNEPEKKERRIFSVKTEEKVVIDDFIRLFPVESITFTEAKNEANPSEVTALNEVIKNLQEDTDISRIVNDLHSQQGERDQSLTSFLQKKMIEGVCYGRLMAYFAQIKKKNSEKQDIQVFHGSVNKADFIKYQILHMLYIFLYNKTVSDAGDLVKNDLSKITRMLPGTHPNDLVSKKLAANDGSLLIEALKKRLDRNAAGKLVVICKYNNQQNAPGHVSLIYHNSKEATRFFYDAFSVNTGGLFTANSDEAFVKGAVDKLMKCALLSGQSSISFHSYLM